MTINLHKPVVVRVLSPRRRLTFAVDDDVIFASLRVLLLPVVILCNRTMDLLQ